MSKKIVDFLSSPAMQPHRACACEPSTCRRSVILESPTEEFSREVRSPESGSRRFNDTWPWFQLKRSQAAEHGCELCLAERRLDVAGGWFAGFRLRRNVISDEAMIRAKRATG